MEHHHQHHVSDYNRAFAIGIALNVGFVIIEALYGVWADSLALLADAGHNASDVMSLLLAWGANLLASKSASEKRTYGFRKVTVMASMISAILLLIALGGITWEAIGRFRDPQQPEGLTVIIVAAIGVVINTLTALLFMKGQHHDLNIRGAFLHMAADAAVSVGVVIAGILIMLKGWTWIDPVVSLAIVIVIFISTWSLLRESTNYMIDAVPKHIDLAGLQQYLLSEKNVTAFHDLHVWPLSSSEVALTVHLVVENEKLDNDFIITIQDHLHDHFNIEHSTIQVESATGTDACKLKYHQCTRVIENQNR